MIETHPVQSGPQSNFQPFISIIVPVYNAELYIQSTIQSVLRQTYKHFEIVVVDDGGTDSSIRLIEAFNDSRIRIIEQANQGVSVARNNGALAANGEYIAFLDADDLWFPDKLALDVETIRRNQDPVCLIYSGYYCVDERNRLLNIAKHPTIINGDFSSVIACNLFPSITLLHKDILRELGGFPHNAEVPQEDRVFLMRVCKKFNAYPTGHRSVLYRQMMSGRALQRLFDYDAMLAAELATIEAMRNDLSDVEFENFRNHHLRSLLNRFLRFNAFENAKRHVKQVPEDLLKHDLKGLITRLSFALNINLLYGCQAFLHAILKYALAPWWFFKRRAAITD